MYMHVFTYTESPGASLHHQTPAHGPEPRACTFRMLGYYLRIMSEREVSCPPARWLGPTKLPCLVSIGSHKKQVPETVPLWSGSLSSHLLRTPPAEDTLSAFVGSTSGYLFCLI